MLTIEQRALCEGVKNLLEERFPDLHVGVLVAEKGKEHPSAEFISSIDLHEDVIQLFHNLSTRSYQASKTLQGELLQGPERTE